MDALEFFHPAGKFLTLPTNPTLLDPGLTWAIFFGAIQAYRKYTLQLAHTYELLKVDETFQCCIDKDGTNSGIDHELIGVRRGAVSIIVLVLLVIYLYISSLRSNHKTLHFIT